MYKTVQKCNHCGANLSLDDMRRTDCPYCKTVYPHHSMAAQHAQMAGQLQHQMMAQQAQVQDQWRGAFGVPPLGPPGQPPMTPGGFVDPNAYAQAHFAHASRMSRHIQMVVLVSVLGSFLLTGLIVVLVVLL